MPIAGRLPAVALAVATVLLALVVADAHSYDRTPYSADGKPMSFHVHRARALIQTGYSLDRWRDKSPATIAERRAWRAHRRAVLYPPARFAITQYRDKLSAKFAAYREERRSDWCSPTPHPQGAGCWVIPEPCVMGESGGSWTADNPTSDARGAYQLLGHGEPWPVDSRADAMAHHRIAAGLYASSGMDPWVHPDC